MMSVYWKKRYGQHLLHDRNILSKIAGSLDLNKDDSVIEIGCGSGALTEYLISGAGRVTAVEVDDQFFDIIEEKFGKNREFRLIKDDILKTDLKQLILPGRKSIIAGNLPYNITSQIIFYLLDHLQNISRMVFLVQKEIAERITAPVRNKNRSILSVICQYHFEPKILFPVSRNCFYPAPNVDSAVIFLSVKQESNNEFAKRFRSVVKSSFGKRRKTLRNNLKSAGIEPDNIQSEFNMSRRPEELSVLDFEELTSLLDVNHKKPVD